MKNNKAFTLIELLVVVLIIAVLAAIALPKYMAARDKAHLSGLMTIGKNVNDALDRRSLFDNTTDGSALDLLDISFKDNTGSDCTAGYCRITVSGKDYLLYPVLNNGNTVGSNYSNFYSYTSTVFGRMIVVTNIFTSGYDYRLYCYDAGWITMEVSVEEDRCEKVATSLGASCTGASGARECEW